MIEIIPKKHHYQKQINYPVEEAQEGFDYYEFEVRTSGNIAEDIPSQLHERLVEIIDKERWTYDALPSIKIDNCVLRVNTTLSYVEHISGNLENLLDKKYIQESLQEGIEPY